MKQMFLTVLLTFALACFFTNGAMAQQPATNPDLPQVRPVLWSILDSIQIAYDSSDRFGALPGRKNRSYYDTLGIIWTFRTNEILERAINLPKLNVVEQLFINWQLMQWVQPFTPCNPAGMGKSEAYQERYDILVKEIGIYSNDVFQRATHLPLYRSRVDSIEKYDAFQWRQYSKDGEVVDTKYSTFYPLSLHTEIDMMYLLEKMRWYPYPAIWTRDDLRECVTKLNASGRLYKKVAELIEEVHFKVYQPQ